MLNRRETLIALGNVGIAAWNTVSGWRQRAGAVLPFALDRKYPNAARGWGRQFVFPAAWICRDPRWGPPGRYHLHESVVQRAVAAAARAAGLTKHVGPHVNLSDCG